MAAPQITRASAKFWVADPATVSPTAAEYIPVFHRWIQDGAVGGLLIDVADYGHVPEGPGVVLIGHEADRALDLAGGPGFRYESKRTRGPVADQIAAALAGAAAGAALLASDPALDGLAFDVGRVRLAVADRLGLPNEDASLALVGPAIAEALARVFPGAEGVPTRRFDARRPFTVDVALDVPVELAAVRPPPPEEAQIR